MIKKFFDKLTGNIDPYQVRADILRGQNLDERYFKPGQELYTQGQQFIKGEGPILEAMRKQMRGSIYDQSAQTGQNMAMQMSQMGLSPGASGGQGTILKNILKNRAGENVAQGLLGISQYGLQHGGGLIDRGRAFTQTGSKIRGEGNTAMALQRAQNAANTAGLFQQVLAPAFGSIARGIEGGIGQIPGMFKGFLGGGSSTPMGISPTIDPHYMLTQGGYGALRSNYGGFGTSEGILGLGGD